MAVTNYLWDDESDNVLMEYDDNGVTQAEYTYEPGEYGELISQRRNGATSYYHYDATGSTRLLTDENGQTTDTYEYSGFGEVIAKTGTTTNPYRYAGARGYYFDEETGDYYVRERVYRPTTGRWSSFDPLGRSIDIPDVVYSSKYLVNRKRAVLQAYAYVANSPLNYVDPSGLEKCAHIPKGQAKQWCDRYAELQSCNCYKELPECLFVSKELLAAANWCGCLTWHEKYQTIGLAWLKKLPDCPCTVGSPPANPKPSVWYDPAELSIFERPGHPYATYCMRSIGTKPDNHAQQCCYDEDGNLITGGPSAGSPDYVSAQPAPSKGHYDEDVAPFYDCDNAGAAFIYFCHRPPNNGNKCTKNEM